MNDEDVPDASLSVGPPAGGTSPLEEATPLGENAPETQAAPVGAPPTDTWGFAEGDEIAPGRSVLQRIGSPSELYDTYLVWDERRFSIMVAKVMRPDRINVDWAQRSLRREIAA